MEGSIKRSVDYTLHLDGEELNDLMRLVQVAEGVLPGDDPRSEAAQRFINFFGDLQKRNYSDRS